jgi:L-fucose mutarotase
MLKNIDPLLSPELLHVLRAMGHGDDIAIVDGNYPGDSAGPKPVRMDGHGAVRVVEAILSVMPLDDMVPEPAVIPGVAKHGGKLEPIMVQLTEAVARHEPHIAVKPLEQQAFYERVKRAYAIVCTSERALYGNIILKKGVIHPER